MKLSLSDREMQVARLICEGRTSRAIARLLDLSPSTIQVHRRNVRLKLKAGNTTDLIRTMLNRKLWEPPVCSGSLS
jgi:two-component system, LuxR family, response regulator FixJ